MCSSRIERGATMNRTIKWISSLVIVLLFSTACELGLGGPTYVPEPVELSVLVLPSDKGYVEIDGSIITPGIPVQVKKGKLVNLVARSRDEGWEFARWERDLAGINSEETLVMDRSKVVRAVFTSVSPPAATPTPRTTKAEQKPIVFAGLNWDTAKIQNAIARFIVEEGYGNATDSVSEDRNSLFLDLVDGDIDVFMEIWLPNQQDVWDNAMANGSVISLGKSLDDNWQSAFVVPTYVVEANPDLKSIQDIRKFKELFPKGSGGNVLLITCLAAWKCSGINESQVKAYGLDDIIEFQDPGSTAALFASLEGAYAKKEPWLGYMWGPSTKPTVELDLTRLEEPQCGVEQQPADGCAYPDVRIRIAVHPGLVERAPDVIEMLRKWDFAAATELAARRYMADTEATFEETAIWYLKNEEDVWTQWVPADVAQAIRDALSILPALPAAATPVPGPTPTPIPTPVLPLAASFSMDVSSGRAPFIVRFSDASQGLVTSWQWDFGDGGSSTEQDPTHEYTAAGSHTVRLTVTGPEGNDVVVLPGAISVGPGPLAEVDMPPAPISVQAEITIQLSAKAVDQFGNEISDVGFTWNAIGTAGSIDRSGLFTAGTEAGTYEGLVMVTSTDGEQHRQASYDVTITPGPVSRVVVEPAEVTLDIGVTQPFTFTALDEFGNQVSDVSATWSVPPGLGTIDSDAVLTVGTKAGEFPGAVRVDAVKGTDRASATAGVSVAPDPLFSIDIEPVTTIVRLGATQRFTAHRLGFLREPDPWAEFRLGDHRRCDRAGRRPDGRLPRRDTGKPL